MATTTKQSPFEQALADVEAKRLATPSVSVGGKPVAYFSYQLAVHHFNMKLMASGMKFRNIRFTDIKNYYGLTGKSAADCLPQFEKVMEAYNAKYVNN